MMNSTKFTVYNENKSPLNITVNTFIGTQDFHYQFYTFLHSMVPSVASNLTKTTYSSDKEYEVNTTTLHGANKVIEENAPVLIKVSMMYKGVTYSGNRVIALEYRYADGKYTFINPAFTSLKAVCLEIMHNLLPNATGCDTVNSVSFDVMSDAQIDALSKTGTFVYTGGVFQSEWHTEEIVEKTKDLYVPSDIPGNGGTYVFGGYLVETEKHIAPIKCYRGYAGTGDNGSVPRRGGTGQEHEGTFEIKDASTAKEPVTLGQLNNTVTTLRAEIDAKTIDYGVTLQIEYAVPFGGGTEYLYVFFPANTDSVSFSSVPKADGEHIIFGVSGTIVRAGSDYAVDEVTISYADKALLSADIQSAFFNGEITPNPTDAPASSEGEFQYAITIHHKGV